MTGTDLTLIVTAHDETLVCGPTMTAADAAVDAARRAGHTVLNVVFDGGSQLNHVIDQDSPFFTPFFLYVRNPYDSLCLSPREAHLEVPYVHRDIPNGLSWQDWQFAIQTMSRGWRHVVVPDTI